MISFPIDQLMDEEKAYQYLKETLHPEGLHCPNGHALPKGQAPHTREREPIVNYRCRTCGAVFNIFSDTLLNGIRYDCVTIVLMLRGFLKGQTTQEMAQELDCDYGNLLKWRHRLQEAAWELRPGQPLEDQVVEVDESYPNAGEKGTPHDDEDDPPRDRGNKQRGRGTMQHDRPPVLGVAGRESSQVRIQVRQEATGEIIQDFCEDNISSQATVNSDENQAYKFLENTAHEHHTVKHSEHEFARDEDGDGVREVHDNTIEGIWTGFKNFLRLFRGVHQKYLHQYTAIYAWIYDLPAITAEFLQALLVPDIGFTLKAT
jgi:transposase-like protein